MEEKLWEACKDGRIEEVQKLLQNSQINTNRRGPFSQTPFYIACKNGHIEIVKLLLNDNRVDINKYNNTYWTPFYVACFQGHIEIVKLLLNDNTLKNLEILGRIQPRIHPGFICVI